MLAIPPTYPEAPETTMFPAKTTFLIVPLFIWATPPTFFPLMLATISPPSIVPLFVKTSAAESVSEIVKPLVLTFSIVPSFVSARAQPFTVPNIVKLWTFAFSSIVSNNVLLTVNVCPFPFKFPEKLEIVLKLEGMVISAPSL